MATRSEYRKNYRNYAEKAAEVYREHLRYRQLRRSAEFAHHEWAWANVECDDSATPSGASPAPASKIENPPTVTQKQLQATDLMPLSKRLTKAKPSLSTLSQSGSETDYEEREADMLGDPLAESGGEMAAKTPLDGQTKPLSDEAERAKIRRAIRQIKQQRQEQQQPAQLQKQPVEKPKRQRQSQQTRRTPPVVESLAYSSGVAEENDYDDYEESVDSTDADYEEQLAAARHRRLQRRHMQRLEEKKKLVQSDAKQQPVNSGATVSATKNKPKQQQQRRRQVPDCPPLELDRVAEESAQALFHRQGPQEQQQQNGQQQQQAESPPIFYPWGMGDQEREYGLKRTFNVRATRDVYDSALRARDRCPPPPRPRPATAGGGPVASAGGRVGGQRASRPGDAKAARDDYWLSEYAKNFAKYANALYARNRQSLASRSRADFL